MEDLTTFDAGFFANHRDVAFGSKSKQMQELIEEVQPDQSSHDEYEEEQLEVAEADNSLDAEASIPI